MAETRTLVTGAIAIVGAIVLAIFAIYGGFEKIEAPIRVVVPEGFTGVACGKLTNGENKSSYTLNSQGYFEASEELRSHRPREILVRDVKSGAIKPASNDIWHPIFTENDPRTGEAFTVVWVGAIDGWTTHAAAHGKNAFCVGRLN